MSPADKLRRAARRWRVLQDKRLQRARRAGKRRDGGGHKPW